MTVGGRRFGRLAIALGVTALGGAAFAQGFGAPRYVPDYEGEYAPSTGPLTLPETLRGTVEVPLKAQPPGMAATGAANTLRELHPILAACWVVPPGLARFERTEITLRFSLRRDGSVIGTPRVTFSTQGSDTRAYRILTEATLAAIRRCTPARITPALGAAIAGRPIALRFIYQGPKGQGV